MTILHDEKWIIAQCLKSKESIKLHKEFTEPENIKSSFVRKIFNIILKIDDNNQEVDIYSIFSSLPKNEKREDTQKCMQILLDYEIMLLENDDTKKKYQNSHIGL
jgi:replicative DNA helicase